jgi:hypothetical protein
MAIAIEMAREVLQSKQQSIAANINLRSIDAYQSAMSSCPDKLMVGSDTLIG